METISLKHIIIDLGHIEDKLELIIDAKSKNTLFKVPNASDYGEAEHQVVEGCYYDYELSDEMFTLIKSQIVQPHSRKKNLGVIAPNIFVGTLSLPIFKDEKEVGDIELEVRSVKTNYREDYRDMLELITEKCTDLLMQANSPVSHNFETDPNEKNKTRYQRFVFIKSIISTDEFSEAIHRIVTKPVTKWEETMGEKDVRSIRRFNSTHIKEFASGVNRSKLSDNHLLRKYGLESLPNKVSSTYKVDTVDTHENRFVKFALETFLRFCSEIKMATKKDLQLFKEATLLETKLESYLQHSLFKKISNPNTLKLNSPSLQRQGGYREILRVWLMFDLAARLVWTGGDDVYKGGKKDIATLYEYWLFFKLLDLFNSVFNIDPKKVEDLIKPTNDNLNLQLKQGEHTALEGVYKNTTRELNVRFNYNKEFKGGINPYPNSGSWTTNMRPDYTLTIWPKDIEEDVAEEEELIVHIHFDAKYKVANFAELLEEKTGKEINKEKEDNRKGIYNNADLLKMHAYKDAIRRTGGAYILYPGQTPKIKQGFHEIIPGLGAFPIRPSKEDDGISDLKNFIIKVVDHLVDRASQRENIATKTHQITRGGLTDLLHEALPEYLNEEKLIPDETYVLVGYCKSKEHHDWYLENGLYNFRMNDEHGSLVFDKSVVSAKYLLLRYDGKANEVYRIISKGVKVFSKEKLIKMKYPQANRNEYIIIEIEKVNTKELGDFEWNYKELNGYKKAKEKHKFIRKHAGIPFTTTLTELMKTKVHD